MFEEALSDDNKIKCFILTNSECRQCNEWLAEEYDNIVDQFPNVTFYTVDCYEEHKNGRMPFPPMIAPTFYFYKDKRDFPLINQGILPEFEMKKTITRAVEILTND